MCDGMGGCVHVCWCNDVGRVCPCVMVWEGVSMCVLDDAVGRLHVCPCVMVCPSEGL